MLNKFVYKLHEKLYQSIYVRHIVSYLYRIYSFADYPTIAKFIQSNKEKTLIAINAYQIYEFNHIKPLYLSLTKDPSYRVILIGSNPRKIKRTEYQTFIEENNFILNENVFSYAWLPFLNPDIFISTAITQYHQLCHNKTIKVLYAHSLSSLGFSKNHKHITKATAYNYILSTGPLQKKALKIAANKYNVQLPEIIPGGFIRGDILAKDVHSFNLDGFYAKCGLAHNNTVMFAPTWGEFSVAVDWIDPIVDLSFKLDFNLLIKLHPLMLKGQTQWETAGIDWPVKLKELDKNNNIHICNRLSLEDYMLGSNIMITGASSVGIEYMFLEKPVIFLAAPKFFEIFGYEKPIYWVRKGLEVENTDELYNKIKDIFSRTEFHQEYDTRSITFNPGTSIKSITRWIKEITQQNTMNYDKKH